MKFLLQHIMIYVGTHVALGYCKKLALHLCEKLMTKFFGPLLLLLDALADLERRIKKFATVSVCLATFGLAIYCFMKCQPRMLPTSGS